MQTHFVKYSACGNDFILIDNRPGTFPIQPSLITYLCHRQRGVGSDGLILLENSAKADYKMRIFNRDGSEAEMCGNGIRCLLRFIHHCGIQGNHFMIETMHSVLKLSFQEDLIAVDMANATDFRRDIPLFSWMAHHIDTGVPHLVIFCDHINNISLNEWGPKLRFHPLFAPGGANVNFAHLDANRIVHIRTYERGVEGETLACGTGATASALIAAQIYHLNSPVKVKVSSGDIVTITFEKHQSNLTNIRLIGPAYPIFSGTIAMPLL